MPEYTNGQTATSKDGSSRVIYKDGLWVKDTTYAKPSPQGERVKTTPDDMKMLRAASERAAAERDSLSTYSGALNAAETMGTGPVKNAWLDMITPDEDDGVISKTLASTVGAIPRMIVSQRTLDARDHLKTTNANVALAGSQLMKGSSSDKDTALMRLSGMGPSKGIAENRRIVRAATEKSGLEQARALITSTWISKYGSVSNASENGMTYEQALGSTERRYRARREQRRLPKTPPRQRGGTLTIDLDGNPIR